jgi:beta-galactosidase
MTFAAGKRWFIRDGSPFFVISGEIHYFRLRPELWRKHLLLLKKSGANTASTYIPWDWHEIEEGKVDFTGATDPRRNLLRYIDLCREVGLDLVVKPGPYILAEYEGHGLPSWLLARSGKDARALDQQGNVISPDVMSYLSDEYLRYAFRWYDAIMPVVAANQHSKGGPITMMQVCNEVGVFQWLSGRIDYNPSVVRLYREFLANRYNSVEALNRRYGTHYGSFAVAVPPAGEITCRNEFRAYFDFHLFYRHYFAVYLDTLVKKIRQFGIDVQLVHNIPGWIFGNAAELPMLISTYDEVMTTRNDIVFGLDHIPEFVSFRNAHSDLACNKILEALQPSGPVWAAEFQAGSREHHVKNDAREMETFYFASLAHGLRGFNYYMYSQGENPEGKGFFGKTFYFQTPLDVEGRKSPLYAVTKKLGEFLKREKEGILASDVKARVCVGFYRPYFYTELTSSQMLKERRLHVERLGLSLDPRFVREDVFFQGLLRGLQTLNVPYDIRDLQGSTVEALLHYPQLWAVTTEFMDAATQNLLAEYVRQGGHLIITPAVPMLDEYLDECTVLRDALELRCTTVESSHKIDAFGIKDVYTFFRRKYLFPSSDAQVVATTETGEACGIHKKVGKGRVTALGFAFGYTTDEHLHLYAMLTALDRARGPLRVSDPDVQYVLRKGRKGSYLFLLNYHNEKKRVVVDSRAYILQPLSCKVIRGYRPASKGERLRIEAR